MTSIFDKWETMQRPYVTLLPVEMYALEEAGDLWRNTCGNSLCSGEGCGRRKQVCWLRCVRGGLPLWPAHR